MTTVADVGFVEMRLSKVVGMPTAQDGPSFCVVLEGVSQDRRLAFEIGEMEAFHLSANLTGAEFGRPMSPQFAASLLRALGGQVRQVRIDRLIEIHDGSAYGSTVEVAGPAGVASVDARPSDALNLAALVPAPIFVAPGVLAAAEADLEGDSAEASLLRLAVEAEQMSIQRAAGR